MKETLEIKAKHDEFKNEAKIIIDALFDTKVFKENITRDDMNFTQDFLGEMMTSRYNSYVKLYELKQKISEQ